MNEEDFLPGRTLEELARQAVESSKPEEKPVAKKLTTSKDAEAPVNNVKKEQPEWPWFIRLIKERKLSK